MRDGDLITMNGCVGHGDVYCLIFEIVEWNGNFMGVSLRIMVDWGVYTRSVVLHDDCSVLNRYLLNQFM